MDRSNDPRNIFVDRRVEYADGDGKKNATDATPKEKQQTSTRDDYQARVEQMKDLAAKYQREGEGQLVKDIVNNVIEQKAAGRLSNEQLRAFAKRIMPLLNSEQRGRLTELVDKLIKL